MKSKRKLNNEELNKISGGKNKLEKYLKSLDLDEKEKERILADYDGGKKLDLNPSVPYDDDDNVYVLKRERDRHEFEE